MAVGSYTIYIRGVSNANANCIGFSSFTVTINPPPTCEITGEQTICAGASSKFTATEGMSSYAWTGPGGFTASTQEITVSTAGVYEVTITDANGCQSTCSRELMLVACGGPLCTYTQGYYGNVGGMSCAPDPENPGEFKQYTTKALIERALEAYGGTMYVGIKDVRHVSIMNTMTDIDAVIAVLPGGGMSKALPTGPNNGLHSISSLPQSLLKDGSINNTLLAQTIVLGLNLGINSNLGNFELEAGTFATADSEEGCGSDIPKARSCNPDGTVNNEYEFYSIPANIVTALGGNATVQGLYALANQALGGGDTNGVSLSAIADVVDKINNAFDGCRIPMGYGVEPLDCPVIETITTQSLMETSLAGFVAYPVPIDGQLTIQCTFDYTSDVTIEVFDINNQLIYTQSQAQCSNGTVITLNYVFGAESQKTYYVRLTTDRGSDVKDVITKAMN
ncbi:hypothetical protein GCM10008015_31460 [Flavobacterium palustre]|uniref:PKD-like domain-containing protein n=1 Tax=Flavobacterium palustre TaxID=1476463 RepID=A0ABQ1HUG5_9FLAO|nr:hypothetical protein GCM10008015_31460 [Flavobacterium palustre]